MRDRTEGDAGGRPGSPDREDRLAGLEAAVAAMAAEIHTKRLVVMDDDGRDRIVAEVAGTVAEVRLDLPAGDRHPAMSVLVFANPGDADLDLGPGVGVQLWVDGEEVTRLVAWSDLPPT